MKARTRTRAGIPMILAAGAVHSWLVNHGLRTFCSITVRSAECLDTHYFAVLVGVGATCVNAYLAQETLADRHAKGLFGDKPLGKVVLNYKKSIEAGLLKILSKMGISVISSYRGGYNFEALGLSPRARRRLLPRHDQPHLRHRSRRPAAQGHRASREGLERVRRRAADRRLLPRPRERRHARPLRRTDPRAAARLRHQLLRRLPQVFETRERAEEDGAAARPARLQAAAQARRRCTRSSRSTRSASASSRPACRSARWARRRTAR